MTVGEWLDRWLVEPVAAKRAVKTITNYRTHVRDAWKPQLGHMLLRDLRRGHIERVLAALALPLDGEHPTGNVGRRITHRSPATIESYRKTIRAALAAAQRRELITVNPALGRIDAILRAAVDADDEPVMWELEDTAQFLEHRPRRRRPHGPTHQRVVTRKEVTPEQARCPICGAVHVGRLLKPPKSRAGRRWEPLAAPAQDALARHRAAQQAERDLFGADYDHHDLVLPARWLAAAARPGDGRVREARSRLWPTGDSAA